MHILYKRTNTLWENAEEYITIYLPIFFLNKPMWIIKSHTLEKLSYIFPTHFCAYDFPCIYLKAKLLLFLVFSLLHSHRTVNGTRVSYYLIKFFPLWPDIHINFKPHGVSIMCWKCFIPES